MTEDSADKRLYDAARAALVDAGYGGYINGGFLAAKGYRGPGLFLNLDAPVEAEQLLAPFAATGLNVGRADIRLVQD